MKKYNKKDLKNLIVFLNNLSERGDLDCATIKFPFVENPKAERCMFYDFSDKVLK